MSDAEVWTSKRYTPQDTAGCLDLMRRLAPEDESASEEFFDWLFQRGPGGAAISVVARENAGGRIIGQATTIPIGLRIAGKPITAGLALNPLIDQQYEGRGVALDLLRRLDAIAADERIAFSYAFPDTSTLPVIAKQGGFTEVASLSLMIRPLKPERMAMKSTGSRAIARSASIARMVWRTPQPAAHQAGLPSLEMDEVTEFDEPFTVFWHRVQNRAPIIVVRDQAYLNWRFLRLPGREYRVFAARSEGKVRAFIVLRAASLGRFTAGLIVDLIHEPTGEGRAAARLLIDHAGALFADQDLDLLGALVLRHTDEYRLFRAGGFWLTPKFLEPQPLHFVLRSHADEANAAYAMKNWFLTLGDSLVG